MKWIGQHIWDFISRFRNDVYLENPTAGDSDPDKFLALDANKKIVYRTGTQVASDIGASGDITGVTITTDSGGGSAASDTGGSADFSILGTSGVGVTNSGTTITATSVPGEIDHNSLLNYDAGRHFAQSSITTVGTIGTGVWQGTAIASAYLDSDTSHLSVAQTFTAAKTFGTTNKLQFRDTNAYINSPTANDLEISATDITLDAAGPIYLDAGAGQTIYLQEAGTTVANFSAHHSATWFVMYENEGASDVDFFDIKVAAAGATTIRTVDDAGTDANLGFSVDGTFSVTSTGIDIATDGTITNATWNGTAIAQAYIAGDAINGDKIADDAVDSEHYTDGSIDTAHIADAQITVAKLHADAIQTSSESYADNDTSLMTSKAIDERINRPTQFIHIQFSSFRDDIGTTEHWVPMHSTAEKSNAWTNEEVSILAPYDGKLLELHYRTSKNTSASSNQATWKLYKLEPTVVINTDNEVVLDTQTVTGPTNAASGAGNVVKVTFDSDATFSAGEMLAISVTHSDDTTDSNTKFYVTTIWEYNISSISQ